MTSMSESVSAVRASTVYRAVQGWPRADSVPRGGKRMGLHQSVRQTVFWAEDSLARYVAPQASAAEVFGSAKLVIAHDGPFPALLSHCQLHGRWPALEGYVVPAFGSVRFTTRRDGDRVSRACCQTGLPRGRGCVRLADASLPPRATSRFPH